MSSDPENVEPQPQSTTNVSGYGEMSFVQFLPKTLNDMDKDYELGRSSFNHLLTDATYFICKDRVDVYFSDVFDDLCQRFPYEECFKQLTIENSGFTNSLTDPGDYTYFPRALFVLVGSVRREENDGRILKLLMTLSKFLPIGCDQPKQKSAILPSDCESSEDGLVNAIMEGSPNSIDDLPRNLSFGMLRFEAVKPSISTPSPTGFLPTRAELVVSQAITSHVPTPPPTRPSNSTCGPEDMALYSMALKELGDEDGKYGSYVEERINFEPPLWRCTVTFRGVEGVGESSKKRTAKHIASRSAYLQLDRPTLDNDN